MNSSWQIPSTPKEHLRTLRVLHISMVTGALLFMIVVIILKKLENDYNPLIKEYQMVLLMVSAGIAVFCLLAALVSFRKALASVSGSLISLDKKLNHYRAAFIRYLAFCEGPALLAIILFFLTQYYYLLMVAGIMIIAMVTKWPSRQRIIAELELDTRQQQELE